ncbi:MAG TPA: 23S rRNA (adenine(2503)-C(2))-methyltransferase RlmN [Chthoniobacteraceae bacterium]|nr:23S rRNA (adenine(2503)-C(2))-methyltransferase RlmN [Chthoniobacteraceae bacterium]
MTRALYDLSFADLEGELTASGLRPVHAKALWRAVHREGELDLGGREDFLPPLRRWVGEGRFATGLPPVSAEMASGDGLTRKFLLRLDDGQEVETVLMGYPGRYTACVSTQAGCAMGCVFCATGQMGFARHLRAGEIVAQVLHCRRALGPAGGLRNLVLMGMGEPLHNYDAVMAALGIITDRRGINIGPARITISTVGVAPGILRLAAEQQPYGLAVSLHGASEEERSALVPASRRWPLVELIAACRDYGRLTGRRIFFEWTLIAGKNDSTETAARLARLLRGIDAHVNLIPLNPTGAFDGDAASAQAVRDFQRVLRDAGFPATVRQRRGIDVAAGCGQLRAAKRSRE